MGNDLVVLKREALYELVWSRPVRSVAADYGLSDVALAKICRRMGIPLPGRGYWARKAAGRKVTRPQLPKLRKDQEEEYRFPRRDPKPPDSAENSSVQARELESSSVIVVPNVLEDPHPLVRRSLAPLQRAAKDFSRANLRHRCLDVMVSPEQLDRALRIMDALLRALDERGLAIEIATEAEGSESKKAANITRVRIEDEWVRIGLEEARSQVKLPAPPGREADGWYYPRADLRPNGTLRLLIRNTPRGGGIRSTWSDGKTARLETRLNDFLVGLHRAAEAIKIARAERERQQAEWREADQRRREEAKRTAIIERLGDDLQTRSEEWSVAGRMSEFLDAVEAVLKRKERDAPEVVLTWLAWGRAYARALADRAVSDLLVLRPERRKEGAPLWETPRVTDEEILQYLQEWGETKTK